MRQKKYRVWSHRMNKMLYPTEISFNWDGKVTVYYGVDIDEKVTVTQEDVMDWTGLKDKNGKEIYEGDLVDFYVGNTKEVMYEVYYDQSAFMCKKIPPWKTDGRYTLRNRSGAESINTAAMYSVEVIGNIYENPELLKV